MNRHNLLTLLVALCVAGLALTTGCEGGDMDGPSLRQERLEASYCLPSEADISRTDLVRLDEGSRLSDYLAYAAINNPGLEAEFNRFKAAIERVPQVSAFPDPRFTYRYYIREVETRVGPQRQSFELAQKFPWFGKLQLRGDAAMEAANAARQRFEARKLKLFYRVKEVYYEYYYLWRAIATIRENRDLVKHFEAVARTRYKVAEASHSDVIRAQVELGKLEDRLRSLEDFAEPIVARLNAALNRPAGAPIPWPQSMETSVVSITDEQLLGLLVGHNPELKGLDFDIASRQYRIDLAAKDYFPDVTLGGNYIDTGNSIGTMSPSDDGKDAIIAMVSVNLPIWWDKLAAGVREARHRHLDAVHRKADRANVLSADLKLASYRFRDAERKIDLFGDTLLPKARQSIKATEASYRAGRGTFLDLIDAQRVFLEFQLAHERALADRMQRLAELEMLIGTEIPNVRNSQTSQAVRQEGGSAIGEKDTIW